MLCFQHIIKQAIEFITFNSFYADDAFGKFMAILALAPLWIGSAFTGLILRCRDLHTVSLFKYRQLINLLFTLHILQLLR